MNSQRIVLLGDSLGMPTGSEEIEYEDTYPYLLKIDLKHFEIISRHRRTNDTSKQLSSQRIFDDIEMLKPDVLVVHLGIVDCAPRVFSRFQNAIFSMLPVIVVRNILRIISHFRYNITKLNNKTYVKKDKFKINIEKFIDISNEMGMQLLFIEILMTSQKNDNRSYNFKNNIIEYNKIIEAASSSGNVGLVKYDTKDFLLKDGIHINKEGNKFLAHKISEKIANLVK
jgi:acyl-CoA thioesterase I